MSGEVFICILGFIVGIVFGCFITIAWYMQPDCPFYKRGYEAAVEDFYKGKLKCDRVEEPVVKYVWKDKVK